MDNKPSDRIIDQRIRNRVMEELAVLSGGNDALRWEGWEYILGFLDWFPDAPDLNPAIESMLPQENAAVAGVLEMVCQFSEEVAIAASNEQLLSSGWAARIAPEAAEAPELLNLRGRHREEAEETEPTAGYNKCGAGQSRTAADDHQQIP